MNEENLKLASLLINKSYIELSSESLNSQQNLIKQLLSQRKLPEIGWDDLQIDSFLYTLSLMDSNNFQKKIGMGEREGRIYSKIVQNKNYYMGHGIGRSGDIKSIQPKATGSSLIYILAEYLVKDAIYLMGYQFANSLILLPLATGMSLTMSFLTLKNINQKSKYVIWPRIDQKTCLKSIIASNLIPVIIENIIENQEIRTNIDEIKKQIEILGSENILCILTTTSCFAVRGFDKIDQISQICKQYDIFHVCNNAYGLQSYKIANIINQSMKNGKLDLVVQSTDKNFMVPVGGSIIFSQNEKLIQQISENYPGRASSSPIFDIFVTLLNMGSINLQNLLTQRINIFKYCQQKLQIFCEINDLELLNTPHNQISIAIFLKKYQNNKEITLLGSILYKLRVMGCRIIAKSQQKNINGYNFQNYGSHINEYNYLPYLTVAIAIGMQQNEVDIFITKLDQSLKKFEKKLQKMN